MSSTSRRSTARTKLTPERIIAVALRVSDSPDGLEAVTLRSLAAELGVGAMTLYGYFRNKDEILDAMADQLLGGLVMPEVVGETPADAIRASASALLELVTEHPSVAALLATRVTRTQTSLRGAMESVLQRLTASGIPGPLVVRVYGFLIQHAMGYASYRAPRPWGHDESPEVLELRRQQSHFYASLPSREFPTMVDLAEQLVVLPSRESFDFAVDALVSHVESHIGAEAPRRKPRRNVATA